MTTKTKDKDNNIEDMSICHFCNNCKKTINKDYTVKAICTNSIIYRDITVELVNDIIISKCKYYKNIFE